MPKIITKSKKKMIIAALVGVAIALFCTLTPKELDKNGIFSPLAFYTKLENLIYDANWKVKFILEDPDLNDSVSVINNDGLSNMNVAEDRIYIVDVDPLSLHQLGSYHYWPRSYHTRAIEKLNEGRASAITFDILFKDADFGAKHAQRTIKALEQIKPNTQWQNQYEEFTSAFNDDSAFIETVRSSPNVIMAATLGKGSTYDFVQEKRELSDSNRLRWINNRTSRSTTWLPQPEFQMEILDDIFPEMLAAAPVVGLVNVIPDQDGIHRSEPQFLSFPNPSFPFTINQKPKLFTGIAMQTALHLMGKNINDLNIIPGEYIEIGKPLGLYKDSNGILKSTYPGLTQEMLRLIYKNKDSIMGLYENLHNRQVGAHLQVAHEFTVGRDEDGLLYADILDAQRLPDNFIKYISLSNQFSDINRLFSIIQKTNTLKLDSGWIAKWDQSEQLIELTDPNDESFYINEDVASLLRGNFNQFTKLQPNEKLNLSNPLDFRVNIQRQEVVCNFIILTKEVLVDLYHTNWNTINSIKKTDTIRFGPNIRVPIDQDGRMLVKYVAPYKSSTGKENSFQRISYSALINGDQDNNISSFPGKIFLLGSTSAALFDQVTSPTEEIYPGIFIHANLIRNLMTNDFFHKVDLWKIVCTSITLGLLLATFCVYFSPILSLILTLLILFSIMIFQFTQFNAGYLWQNVPLIFTIFGSMTAGIVIKYFFEEKEKKQVVGMFKNYISPELIDQMIQSEKLPELGGKEGHLTAFFTDIAGFSTFSEKLGSPQKLVELLNEYLTAMTNILLQNKGTLDKYEGDAIIAFFGAPVQLENHAAAACHAALGMQEELSELRLKWAKQGSKWPKIVHQMRMRIGLNSGMIVTGNMGSGTRMNYTMMGDAVNLAARLESIAKQYGTYTLVSKETLDTAGEEFFARRIDRVQVVGKSDVVEIYELLGLNSKINKDHPFRLLKLKFEAAWNFYADGQWQEAYQKFEECLKFEPESEQNNILSKACPSSVFMERCKTYISNPPTEPWNGVHRATEK